MHAIGHLDYVVLFARDMLAMRRFYSQIMGFELQRELMPEWGRVPRWEFAARTHAAWL
jgi:catechol 2,3-dioxygenase-like lactoylglutathione lyase family enzyme